MSYNESKILYCLYNTKTHEYLGDGDEFGFFCNARLFTSPGHIKNSLRMRDEQDTHHSIKHEPRYPKLHSGELQIREVEITKWQAKELLY